MDKFEQTYGNQTPDESRVTFDSNLNILTLDKKMIKADKFNETAMKDLSIKKKSVY